jgi:hypothetical protein
MKRDENVDYFPEHLGGEFVMSILGKWDEVGIPASKWDENGGLKRSFGAGSKWQS